MTRQVPMTSPEQWLALTLAVGQSGLRGARTALERMGSPEAVLGAGAAELESRCGLKPELARRIAQADSPAFRIECRLAAEHGVRLVPWDDPEYPAALRDLPSAPLLLYVQGAWPIAAGSPTAGSAAAPAAGAPAASGAGDLSAPAEGSAPALAPPHRPARPRGLTLAVVGTRRPTRYGEQMTRSLIAALARLEPGLTILSGMARGIDGIAHEAALEAQLKTAAVLGNGLSRVYPPEHEALAARLREQGALLTEFPMTAAPLPQNFPVRNRIIAGMAQAVLIVEAGEQSGSLITAGLAQAYGRALLALPANADQREGLGTNRLLQSRQARLVLEPGDILAALTGKPPEPLAKGPLRPARKGGPVRDARKAGGKSGHAKATAAHAATSPSGAASRADVPLPPGPPGRILGALRSGPQHPDELAQAAGLSIEQALGLLLELELSGDIVQTANHGYALP